MSLREEKEDLSRSNKETPPRVSPKGEDQKLGDIAKIIGQQWNALSDAKKQKYKKLNEKDKERYNK